jgi:hypothetical protein
MLYDLMKPHITNLQSNDYLSNPDMESILDLELGRPMIKKISQHATFIALTTIFSALKMRQYFRYKRDKPPKLMFEEITRKNADESIGKLIKYLLNYGFYKFGIEVTLIVMLILISSKLDLLSLFYIPFFVLFAFKGKMI